ncbi:MAG: hypothetical protein ACREGG_03980 [Candidatus Saccharimonadales bacterium]
MRIEGTPSEDPSGRLRGLEKFKRSETTHDIGSTATLGVLRGLEKFGKPEDTEGSLVPEDYDLPSLAQEQIKRMAESPELRPIDDPEGVLRPGLLMTSVRDPDHRRLLVDTYRGKNVELAAIHIEGEPAVRKIPIDELRRKIADGELVLPSDPEPRPSE